MIEADATSMNLRRRGSICLLILATLFATGCGVEVEFFVENSTNETVSFSLQEHPQYRYQPPSKTFELRPGEVMRISEYGAYSYRSEFAFGTLSLNSQRRTLVPLGEIVLLPARDNGCTVRVERLEAATGALECAHRQPLTAEASSQLATARRALWWAKAQLPVAAFLTIAVGGGVIVALHRTGSVSHRRTNTRAVHAGVALATALVALASGLILLAGLTLWEVGDAVVPWAAAVAVSCLAPLGLVRPLRQTVSSALLVGGSLNLAYSVILAIAQLLWADVPLLVNLLVIPQWLIYGFPGYSMLFGGFVLRSQTGTLMIGTQGGAMPSA